VDKRGYTEPRRRVQTANLPRSPGVESVSENSLPISITDTGDCTCTGRGGSGLKRVLTTRFDAGLSATGVPNVMRTRGAEDIGMRSIFDFCSAMITTRRVGYMPWEVVSKVQSMLERGLAYGNLLHDERQGPTELSQAVRAGGRGKIQRLRVIMSHMERFL